jgi:hypothetical protein
MSEIRLPFRKSFSAFFRSKFISKTPSLEHIHKSFSQLEILLMTVCFKLLISIKLSPTETLLSIDFAL